MSFLNTLFGRRQQSQPQPDPAIACAVAELAGCDWETVDPQLDARGVTDYYMNALHEGRMVGFHPLLVAASPLLLETLSINCEDNAGLKAYRGRLLTEDAEDGQEILRSRLAELTAGEDDPDLYGAFDETAAPPDTFAGCGYGEQKADEILLLLKLPTEHPWRSFAFMPVGSWNDCPSASQMMAVCKYWHAKYGAFPAMLSNDILQLYVPVPVTLRTQAMQLAEEHFAFCNDIVDQGTGTIGNLAGLLADSHIWYFRWE
ncbi:MAG: DUF4253 domain-containing protein [Oscillospiraceae bacterium]|nr:DUF4253 domain-containing protein [Oscillospiraceae bacterium]